MVLCLCRLDHAATNTPTSTANCRESTVLVLSAARHKHDNRKYRSIRKPYHAKACLRKYPQLQLGLWGSNAALLSATMFESTNRHFVILVVIAVIVLAIGVDIMTLVVVVVVIVVVVVVVVVIVVVIVVVVVVVVVVVIVVVVVVVVVVVIVVIVIIVIVVVVVVVVVVIIIVVIVVVVIVVIVVVVVVVVVIVVVVIVVIIVIVIVIVVAARSFAQEVPPSLFAHFVVLVQHRSGKESCLTCSCVSVSCACHRCCLAIACDLRWYWVNATKHLFAVLAMAHIPPTVSETRLTGHICLFPHEAPTIITLTLACCNLSKARSGHSSGWTLSGWTPSGWAPSGWCCCRRCLMMSLHLLTQVGEILLQTLDNGREMNVQTLDRALHFCHVIFVCLGCFRVAIFVFLGFFRVAFFVFLCFFRVVSLNTIDALGELFLDLLHVLIPLPRVKEKLKRFAF